MGSGLPKIDFYCKDQEPAKKGYSKIFRNPLCKDGLLSTPPEGYTTGKDMVLHCLKNFKNNPCFGSPVISNKDGDVKYESYNYRTYENCIDEAVNFGNGLNHLKLCPPVSEFRDYTC